MMQRITDGQCLTSVIKVTNTATEKEKEKRKKKSRTFCLKAAKLFEGKLVALIR